jgi:hypothetical protein
MIQETARHNGHADIIREAIDGTTGQRSANDRPLAAYRCGVR